MQRYGQVIGVKPEKLEEYTRYHAAVWPEILDMIRQCNIRNYSIFHKDDMLFAYFEYVGDDFDADMAKMAADPEDPGVVGHHDAHAAADGDPRRGRVVGDDGRSVSHGLARSPRVADWYPRTSWQSLSPSRLKDIHMERTANGLAKLDRMNKALRHEEADRVPISDFFWGSFLERWREDLGLPADTDIYEYYDLDWQVTIPNMDPHIKPVRDPRGDRRGGDRPHRLRGGDPQEVRRSRCPNSRTWTPTPSRRSTPSSSTIPGTTGAISAPATTRSPAWATAMPAIRRPGSTRSSRSTPTSRSTAASARPTST